MAKDFIKISIEDLKSLLVQQKTLVVEKLLSQTYSYNTESSDSHLKSISNIDRSKFLEVAISSKFPTDFEVLNKYLS
jgi:hypothetical protein